MYQASYMGTSESCTSIHFIYYALSKIKKKITNKNSQRTLNHIVSKRDQHTNTLCGFSLNVHHWCIFFVCCIKSSSYIYLYIPCGHWL